MSEEARVYGCIVGTPGSTADWYGLYPLNQAAVHALPAEDAYPPLTCGMLTVPMDFGRPRSPFYRAQIIHFGASFNHLSESWHPWLAKFEGLLRRLYWSEARLHLQIELHGAYDYHWRAAWDGTPPWLRYPPEPTAEWRFEGGPRDFGPTESGAAPDLAAIAILGVRSSLTWAGQVSGVVMPPCQLGFAVSKTLFVNFRNGGFWALDVVSAVFLKHLVDAANIHLEHHGEPWLADAVAHWRVNAVFGGCCGLFLDDSWSVEQIATFTKLAREACDALSKRDKIPAEEIQSWQMIEGKEGRCFARGLPAVTTASAIRLDEAIIKLINGTLPESPRGTWWFFGPEDSGETIRKRGN